MKRIVSGALLIMIFTQSTCNKSTKDCVGPVIPDCNCTMQYDPVCGCDNKTYGNACTARCAGVKTWVKGECK